MQRDRDFDHYQDDGAFYNRRPGIWVEPRGNWGAGAVQLVEIPTDDEVHDNIVAYWKPSAPVGAGDTPVFDYRLYWQDQEPHPPQGIAQVVATRIGRGGIPGAPPPKGQWKFVVDFAGGALAGMAASYDVSPVVTLSRGRIAFAKGELRAEKGDGHYIERPPFSPVHIANSTWKSQSAPKAVRRADVTP